MKKIFHPKTVAFGSLIVMLILLIITTFIEKYKGTPFVAEHIYQSCYFVAIWFVIAIGMLVTILRQKMYRRPMTFLLHLSFLVILCGAFLTFTTSKQGTIHLRLGKPTNAFVDKKSNEQQKLPFDILLSDFKVVYYPGTQSPSDYVSYITIRKNQEERGAKISMNKIFAENGFRFYQSGYDNDRKGTILMVKTDRYGLPVTYFGYALLFISMVGFFFSKKSNFRKLLHHPALKKVAMIIVLFVTGNVAIAGTRALPEKIARELGEMQMLYHDRVAPVQTFAKEFTLKLYGKASYHSFNAEQVLSGWLLYQEDWVHEPMIKIKDKRIREMIGVKGKYASFSDFFTDGMEYKLSESIERIYRGGQPEAMKEIMAADEKIQLIWMLQLGVPLTIFPDTAGEEMVWFSPADDLPGYLPDNEKLLMKSCFDLLREYAGENDMEKIALTLDKLKLFQKKKAGDLLLLPGKLKAEYWYNRLNIAKPIALANILLGIFALIYFFRKNGQVTTRSSRVMSIVLNIFLLFSWLGITVLIGLRSYVSGRVPLGNGAETMQFLASCIMLLACLFQRRFFLFLPFGFIFSGLVLLVSGMGAANPQITQLQPVLVSPLLSAHVSLIMMAYTLFGFVMLNGLFTLLQVIFSGDRPLLEINDRITQLSIISRILLYPALFLLAAGIFVGAIWAEVSWGTYWSWDPKETWALITMIIYALAIHPAITNEMRHPLLFHIYVLFAFLSVLMTYFGVNYLLGGMHSYGGEMARDSLRVITVSVLFVFVMIPVAACLKYRKLKN